MKKTTFTLCLSFFCTFAFSQFQYHWGNQFVSSSTSFGSSTYAYFIDTEIDANGNIYGVGNFVETVDIDPGPGVQNITAGGGNTYNTMLVKFNSNGELIWAHTFVSPNIESICTGIEMDSQSDLYLVLETPGQIDMDPGAGTANVGAAGNVSISTIIAKYDTTGAFIDLMEITRPYSFSAFNQMSTLYISDADSVYLFKGFGATMDVDPGTGVFEFQPSSPAWFNASYDTDFNFGSAFMISAPNWIRTYNMAVDDQANRYVSFLAYDNVDIAPGPGVFNVTAPTYNFGINEGDVVVVKYSPDGTPLSMIQVEEANEVRLAEKQNGGLFLLGQFSANTDFDPAGGLQTTFVGRDQTGFLASYDSNFALEWVGQFAHPANGYSGTSSLVERPSGEIVVGTFISPGTDVDPSSGFVEEQLTNSAPYGAVALIRLNADGSYLAHTLYDDRGLIFNQVYLFPGPNESLLYLSIYQDTVDMDPGPGVALAPYAGNGVGGFIINLDYSSVVGREITRMDEEGWKVWPNPAHEEVFLTLDQPLEAQSTLRLLSLMGTPVRTSVLLPGEHQHRIDLYNLPTGMYFIELETDGHRSTRGLVIY